MIIDSYRYKWVGVYFYWDLYIYCLLLIRIQLAIFTLTEQMRKVRLGVNI